MTAVKLFLWSMLSVRDPYPEANDAELQDIRERLAATTRGYMARGYAGLAKSERRKLRRIDKALQQRGYDLDLRTGKFE